MSSRCSITRGKTFLLCRPRIPDVTARDDPFPYQDDNNLPSLRSAILPGPTLHPPADEPRACGDKHALTSVTSLAAIHCEFALTSSTAGSFDVGGTAGARVPTVAGVEIVDGSLW